jgi:hypothetical protein
MVDFKHQGKFLVEALKLIYFVIAVSEILNQ